MIPRVTSKGKSFKGAGAYFLHDLGKAETAERVAFTHTVNMLTDDPEKALRVMAWTAEHATDLKIVAGHKLTGRKAENPVYNYCLAWAPDQNPDQAHMVEFGLKSLQALGVSEHEALFIAHDDTDHKHLHIMVNRVHPVTGIMAKMDHDQNRLSRLAQGYEEETGRVYCQARVENNRQRDRGEKHVVDQNRDQRQAQTPEYRQRRAERIEAQQKAAALALEQIKAREAMESKARDLRAAFDQSAGHDDRQYRAKDIERPVAEERTQAAAAWADEQAQDRARTGGEGGRAPVRPSVREQQRRAWLDQKRQAEWTDYEAAQLQKLNDKQTDRREGLRELQATGRVRFEERMSRKYDPNRALLERQIETLSADLHKKGVRAVLDKITGAHADKLEQLKALELAAQKLQEQKNQERARLEAKQKEQRAAQAKRQDEERARVADRLDATKVRQDAKFLEREAERARRLGLVDARGTAKDAGANREAEAQRATRQAQEAQRLAVRNALDERAREREVREEVAPFRRRYERDRGYER